jgi:hypothetical protein
LTFFKFCYNFYDVQKGGLMWRKIFSLIIFISFFIFAQEETTIPSDWNFGSYIDTTRVPAIPQDPPSPQIIPGMKRTFLYSWTYPYAPPGCVPESVYVHGTAVKCFDYPYIVMERWKWEPATGICSVGVVTYHPDHPDSLYKWQEFGRHQATYRDGQGNRYRTPVWPSLYQVLYW